MFSSESSLHVVCEVTAEQNTNFIYTSGLYSQTIVAGSEKPLLLGAIGIFRRNLDCDRLVESDRMHVKTSGERMGRLYAVIYHTSFENSLGAAQFWI